MTIEDSLYCVLQVDTNDSPFSYATVGGQADTRLNLSARRYPTSNKSTGGWETALGGRRQFEVTCRGYADWPDTTGLEVVRAAHQATGTAHQVAVKVVLNSAGANYTAICEITDFEIDAPNENATQYNFTLVNATGAPVYSAS